MCAKAFEPAQLNGLDLSCRIIRSATHEGMADDRGRPTEELIRCYERLARGGVGLIIAGYSGISQQGKCPLHNMTMLDSDELIPAWRELTDRVHAAGGKIFAQVAHSGRQTRKKITGMRPAAPSALRDFLYWDNVPHRLTEREIHRVTDDFAAAMLRAKAAGFDGVQLHCAHGYLLSGFLSPHMNHRRDKWGGSTENRFRIVGEIMQKARPMLGDFPIIVKINCFEKAHDGIKPEEAVKIAKLMENAGFDAIEVSCALAAEGFGMSRGGFPYKIMCVDNYRFEHIPPIFYPVVKPFMWALMHSPEPTVMYNVDAAAMIKQAVSVPVAVVGGIHTVNDINSVIDSGKADFVSISRPLILEPDLVNKFKSGTQSAARCICCNYCLIGAEQRPLRCYYGKLPKN